MESLQELIFRARFIMADAPERLKIFDLVNGRRNTEEIAKFLKRHVNNVRRDLTLLSDAGLIQALLEDGKPVKKDGFPVYDKVPLARTIPSRYFIAPSRLPVKADIEAVTNVKKSRKPSRIPLPLTIPNEEEVLQIAKNGEDQIYEFKRQGTDIPKITKEIAAMLNTNQGGIIFYGIEDDGSIEGSDLTAQQLDQPIQNSIRSTISPSVNVKIKSVQVMGSTVIIILVPPWNRRDVYVHVQNEKVYIRKGTNVFAAKQDELKKLHSGIIVDDIRDGG